MGELATTVTGKPCKRWDLANFTEGVYIICILINISVRHKSRHIKSFLKMIILEIDMNTNHAHNL